MLLPYHNLKMQHQNPGAEKALVLPINVICNTDNEVIYNQICHNSRLPQRWVTAQPAHDGIAVICGSGPSIKNHVEDVRALRGTGIKIFALNGCAKFLSDNGILPDYQVILDARKETATLIGPAEEHLFSSQVHPKCFQVMPSAHLWHLDVGRDLDELLPDNYPEHVVIGGAASVGNTATCLAFAMGYRHLKLFGYDSSHADGKGHAFHQKMNDGDPLAYVDFNGKTYLCSLTMKLQAEKFMTTSKDLQSMGCVIEVFGTGLLPDMFHAPQSVLEEASKYDRVWSHPYYRIHSPGEQLVEEFIQIAQPAGKVIDFGCGTGRASLRMLKHGLKPFLIDFTENSRDQEAMSLPFMQADLSLPMHAKADYGFCTDVLEHLPPEQVKSAIHNIMESAGKVFLQISTVPDEMGKLIGQQLHLTVRPHEWWKHRFQDMGCRVAWEEKRSDASLFFVERSM
jgi:SAM-dependent methyltransferase